MELRNLLIRLTEDTIIEIFDYDTSIYKGKVKEVNNDLFTRKIHFVEPTHTSRENILEIYLKKENDYGYV